MKILFKKYIKQSVIDSWLLAGSPFSCSFIDANSLHVRWESIRQSAARKPVSFEVNIGQNAAITNMTPGTADIVCRVTGVIFF